jgi:hypothetical protein
MNDLWLGYDNVSIPYAEIAAVLIYQPAYDRRILAAHGKVPANIRAVVVTTDGRYLPSSWRADQLRQRLIGWRATAAS